MDRPHDTLAAEEFVIGTRDDRWPRDPSGYYEPHDVLAAEAFPMPVPDRGGAMPPDARRGACCGSALVMRCAAAWARSALRSVRSAAAARRLRSPSAYG